MLSPPIPLTPSLCSQRWKALESQAQAACRVHPTLASAPFHPLPNLSPGSEKPRNIQKRLVWEKEVGSWVLDLDKSPSLSSFHQRYQEGPWSLRLESWAGGSQLWPKHSTAEWPGTPTHTSLETPFESRGVTLSPGEHSRHPLGVLYSSAHMDTQPSSAPFSSPHPTEARSAAETDPAMRAP